MKTGRITLFAFVCLFALFVVAVQYPGVIFAQSGGGDYDDSGVYGEYDGDDDWDDHSPWGYPMEPDDATELAYMMLAQAGPVLEIFDEYLRPHWEYQVVAPGATGSSLDEQLKEAGSERWELVSVASDQLIFKRRTLSAEDLALQSIAAWAAILAENGFGEDF